MFLSENGHEMRIFRMMSQTSNQSFTLKEDEGRYAKKRKVRWTKE